VATDGSRNQLIDGPGSLRFSTQDNHAHRR